MLGTLLTITTIGTTALGGYNVARFAVGRVKLRKKQLAEAKALYSKLDRTLEFAEGAYNRVAPIYNKVVAEGPEVYAAELKAVKARIEKILADNEQASV